MLGVRYKSVNFGAGSGGRDAAVAAARAGERPDEKTAPSRTCGRIGGPMKKTLQAAIYL